jgi:putative membrane protein insertion efficiency factor
MNIGQRILILLIRSYQATISPALPVLFGPAGRCRFTPSCSQYAREAIQAHGVMAGSVLAAGRLCRCNPWGASGEDPVPAPGENRRLGLGLRLRAAGPAANSTQPVAAVYDRRKLEGAVSGPNSNKGGHGS